MQQGAIEWQRSTLAATPIFQQMKTSFTGGKDPLQTLKE
jgi:hypothetical protein